MEGQWDRPPASLLASTPEPPQHRHLYPPHRHHHHSTTIPHRLRRFTASPLRHLSSHLSPQRLLSFIAFAHHLLLLLILHIDTASSPKTPPTSTAVASTTCSSLRSSTISDVCLGASSLVFHDALAKCSLFQPLLVAIPLLLARKVWLLLLVARAHRSYSCSCALVSHALALTVHGAHSTRVLCLSFSTHAQYTVEHCFILYCIYCIV